MIDKLRAELKRAASMLRDLKGTAVSVSLRGNEAEAMLCALEVAEASLKVHTPLPATVTRAAIAYHNVAHGAKEEAK